MDKAKFMVFLKTPVDVQLREILKGYIASDAGLDFLICSEWEQNGSFIYLKVVHAKAENHWRINVPVTAVLSVADFSESTSVGFTRKTVNPSNS